MAPADSTRTRRELARVIFSRLVGMIVIMGVVLASALATSYFAPWRYRSRVMMLARAGAGQATVEGRATLRERLSLFVVTQRELVRSDPVLAAALMKFHGVRPRGPRGADGVQPYSPKQVAAAFYKTEGQVQRELILSGQRPDGRAMDEIRPLGIEVGVPLEDFVDDPPPLGRVAQSSGTKEFFEPLLRRLGDFYPLKFKRLRHRRSHLGPQGSAPRRR